MDKERILATEAATVAGSEPRIEIVTERRPAYSAAFRARVVAEASVPGIRAPDLARRYGIHVSLIYRWRRMAKAQTKVTTSARPRRQRRPTTDAVAVPLVTFIPVGLIGHPEQAVLPAIGVDGTPRPSTTVPRRPARYRGDRGRLFRATIGMSDRASSRSTWRAARRCGWIPLLTMRRCAVC
jgi:hypothetical protein